jgi:hypothetical protein
MRTEQIKTMNTMNLAIDWRAVKIHFGKKAGTPLGSLTARDLKWWSENWTPNEKFCRSKLTEEKVIPGYHVEAQPESQGWEDESGDWIDGDDAVEAHDVPERKVTVRVPDPANCPDCALLLALKAAMAEPKAEPLAPLPETLNCEFKVGEKVRRAVRVEKVSSWTSEFNRKKVTQYGAYFRNCDVLLYWKSSSMPDEIREGAEFEIEGTVKDLFFKDLGTGNERVIALQRCKIVAGYRLTPKASMVLFCDGKSSADRIAVCDADGNPLFAGHAGIGRPSNGDNTDHELAAALKALTLADAARMAAGHDCIAIELRFDAKWMEGMVGKAAPLREFARLHGLKVTMTHIPGDSNPADEFTVNGGEISNQIEL